MRLTKTLLAVAALAAAGAAAAPTLIRGAESTRAAGVDDPFNGGCRMETARPSRSTSSPVLRPLERLQRFAWSRSII